METPNTLSALNLETGISFQALLPSAQSFHRSSGSPISPGNRQLMPMTAIDTEAQPVPAQGERLGSLVIVGSGLRSICQFTMEAVMHIEAADKVYYCVIDAATKGFIEGKNSNSVNLYEYYSNEKPRFETYIQMAEVMLRSVRAGQKVVGVFYGHPGVFVAPSHRAIAIARDEGFSAQMLPGISAEDCLFADLLIDPSNPGTQTVEATDMLARERPLQTSSHVIIYQVGCIGNLGFNYSGINNDMFNILVDRLAADYGPDHPVVDYLAPMSPLSDASIRRYIISDLLKVEVKNTITAASTFYLPPKKLLQLTSVVETFLKCGDTRKFSAIKEKQMFPPNPFNPSLAQFTPPYGPAEVKAVKDLDIHTTPPQFIPYSASLAMQKAVESIYLNLDVLRTFQKSPSAFAASIEGLEPHETEALSSGNAERINVAMQGNISPVAVASTIVVACVFMLFV